MFHGDGRSGSPLLFPLLILCTALLLAACNGAASGPTGAPIEVDALPEGVGRGFAEILPAEDGGNRRLAAGDPAPDFYLLLDDGHHISLEDLRGRPVLLNFWATWCGPCRMEMPDIVAASEAGDDLVVLAVNVQEELKAVEPFAAEFEMNMPVVRDVEGKVRTTYGVQGMPTTIFIDREGNISAIWAGRLNRDLLSELLNEIL